MLDSVKAMLLDNTLCVMCTTSEGLPYCSLMTYVLSEDLKTVYMVTVRESRKYRNLKENARVSLLVDNRQRLDFHSEEHVASITFEGVHRPLNTEESEGARDLFAASHSELHEILKNPDCVIFGVELKTFLLLNGPVDSVQGEV